MTTNGISRRVVLRAAGAAIALPWLESLPAVASARGQRAAAPKRFAVLFMGNGVNGNHWWARGRGAAMQLGRSLAPLEPVKRKINVINGLFCEPAVGNGIHPAQTGALLSGVPIPGGPAVRSAITIDQAIAARAGDAAPIPSLTLACERPARGSHETGFSLAYSSYLSWDRAGAPVPAEIDPRAAFDRVFEVRARGRRASVVDCVRDRVRHAVRSVSASDAARLDGYLTRVRDVERRVEFGASDLRDRIRLMCDIVALAFQADRTRVASLLLARDLSSLGYPFLRVNGDHHSVSHDDLSDGYERIVRFHVRQLAYLAGALDAMPEGEGTVLDNCCLLWLSNMWSGWKHDNRKLPVVTIGGLGGALETGRALEYLYAGDENRRLCAVFLSIAAKMGAALDRFGDADAELEGF